MKPVCQTSPGNMCSMPTRTSSICCESGGCYLANRIFITPTRTVGVQRRRLFFGMSSSSSFGSMSCVPGRLMPFTAMWNGFQRGAKIASRALLNLAPTGWFRVSEAGVCHCQFSIRRTEKQFSTHKLSESSPTWLPSGARIFGLNWAMPISLESLVFHPEQQSAMIRSMFGSTAAFHTEQFARCTRSCAIQPTCTWRQPISIAAGFNRHSWRASRWIIAHRTRRA